MAAMLDLWTGRFELLTPPSEWGDTGCFTNVVAWAENEDDFRMKVSKIFQTYSWFVVDAESCKRIDDCENFSAEMSEQIETAKSNSNACVYGTLHYFPSKPA